MPGETFDIGGLFRKQARYRISVVNAGPGDASDAVLTVSFNTGPWPGADRVSIGLSVSVSAGRCEPLHWGDARFRFTNGVTCRLGTIGPGETVRLDLGARVHQTGSLYARAEVVSATADPATGNNVAQVHTVFRCEGCFRK